MIGTINGNYVLQIYTVFAKSYVFTPYQCLFQARNCLKINVFLTHNEHDVEGATDNHATDVTMTPIIAV